MGSYVLGCHLDDGGIDLVRHNTQGHVGEEEEEEEEGLNILCTSTPPLLLPFICIYELLRSPFFLFIDNEVGVRMLVFVSKIAH